MIIEFNLKNIAAKLLVVALALAAFALLVVLIFSRFIVGMLSDDRFVYGRETLAIPLEYFPNSARLNAKLAEAELLESDRDLARAEQLAHRAISFFAFQLSLSIDAGFDQGSARRPCDSGRGAQSRACACA